MLGSTAVEGPQGAVPLPARKPRSILAALALTPGGTVSADRLVDLVWGESPPAGAHGTLHAYLSGLRRVLEPDLAPRARLIVLRHDRRRLPPRARPGQPWMPSRSAARSTPTTGPSRRCGHSWAPGPTPAGRVATRYGSHVEALEEALRAWAGTPTPTSATTRTCWPTGRHSTSCGRPPRRTPRWDCWPSASTRRCCRDRAGRGAAPAARADPVAAGAGPGAHRAAGRGAGRAARLPRRLLADELGLDPGRRCARSRRPCCGSRPCSAPGCGRRRRPRARRADPASGGSTVRGADLRADAGIGAATAATPAARTGRSTAAPATSWAMVGRERRASRGHRGAGRRRRRDAGCRARRRRPGHRQDPARGHRARRRAHGWDWSPAVGRCSQDDGAPPLWPWYALLDGLGVERPAELARADDGTDEWDRSARSPCRTPWPGRCASGPRTRPCCSSSRTCTGPTPAPCAP